MTVNKDIQEKKETKRVSIAKKDEKVKVDITSVQDSYYPEIVLDHKSVHDKLISNLNALNSGLFMLVSAMPTDARKEFNKKYGTHINQFSKKFQELVLESRVIGYGLRSDADSSLPNPYIQVWENIKRDKNIKIISKEVRDEEPKR